MLCFCEYSYSNEKPILVETCYIDNNYVLLYKIINWWNDSAPGDDNILCGNTLRCDTKGISTIRYNSVEKLLTISTNSDIEGLVSIFKECKSCKGLPYFTCTYLNEKYFEKITVENAFDITTIINTIKIKNVTNKQAQQLINIEEYIAIELKGIIGGLLLENGKIALHQNGNFLKSCPQSHEGRTKGFKTTLAIKNYITNEILVKYTAVIN